MQNITRDCLILFDLQIRSSSNSGNNFAGDSNISLTNIIKFGTTTRAIYRFNRPTKLRAGQTISSALMTLTFNTGAGASPPDLKFAAISQPAMTVDATWDKYDGVNAWGSVGGDFVDSAETTHIEVAESGNATAKTYDISNVVEKAVAIDPNGAFIDILVKWDNEVSSSSVVFEAYLDDGSEPDTLAPMLNISFDAEPPTYGTGGSVSLVPAFLGLRV